MFNIIKFTACNPRKFLRMSNASLFLITWMLLYFHLIVTHSFTYLCYLQNNWNTKKTLPMDRTIAIDYEIRQVIIYKDEAIRENQIS